MIERLLEADRLLALGMDEQAEKIYWQAAEMDPRNAIAIVGLARVASDRGDDRTALQFAHKALEVDPENPAAIRLVARLQEIIEHREAALEAGAADAVAVEPETARGAVAVEPNATTEPEAAPEPTGSGPAAGGEPPAPTTAQQTTPPASPSPRPATPQKPRRGIFRRLIGGG